MTSNESRRERIVDLFRYWYEQHGACVWSVKQVADAVHIPERELYESDNFTGLLMDLCNEGFLARSEDHFGMVMRWD